MPVTRAKMAVVILYLTESKTSPQLVAVPVSFLAWEDCPEMAMYLMMMKRRAAAVSAMSQDIINAVYH